MKIAKVRIHNFRSIRDATIMMNDFTVLVGPNNHGKSNIIRAIEFVLSPAAKPDESDFCMSRPEDDSDLWVELTFNQLTEQERTTFKRYILRNDTLKVRKTATLGSNGNIEISYHGYVDEPKAWWLQENAFERLNTREKIMEEAQSEPGLLPLLDMGGRITQQRLREFQAQYIDEHREELEFAEVLEASPFLGTRNVGGGVLPDFYLVPAVRDVREETKTKSTTTFGRLLQRAVAEMAEADPHFEKLRATLTQLVEVINSRSPDNGDASTIAQLERSLSQELAQWGASVSIEFQPPEARQLVEQGTELLIDDGVKTTPDKKGHGLQRATLFALLRAWAAALRKAMPEAEGQKPRRASESLIFSIEEPELYLHPHAQRQLASTLRQIAHTPGHQVIVCSHSTHFVDLEHYRAVVIVSKENPQDGTTIRQCTTDLFEGDDADDKKSRFRMAYWINPDRGELFFAKRVVLVEGETERVALPFLADKIGCLDPTISVIDCGSKFNLRLYIAILNAFQLPYVVLHDEDPLPDPIPSSWSEDRRKSEQRTYDENEKIRKAVDVRFGRVEMVPGEFEELAGISKTQAERKGKALAALEHLSGKSVEELPPALVEIVRSVYNASRTPDETCNSTSPAVGRRA